MSGWCFRIILGPHNRSFYVYMYIHSNAGYNMVIWYKYETKKIIKIQHDMKNNMNMTRIQKYIKII